MNPVFATEAFWDLYVTCESHPHSEEDIARQLNQLREGFVVREETGAFDHAGKTYTYTNQIVEFPFRCGERFSLLLEYGPAEGGCTEWLFLVDTSTGTKHWMGWWDLARWHPYCLRPCELDLLLQFWARFDDRWEAQELPLLLLCQFVGFDDATTFREFAGRVEAAYRSLGLPPKDRCLDEEPVEAYEFVDEPNGEDELVPLPSETDQTFEEFRNRPAAVPLQIQGDYRWELDGELGWTFTSDEYCCYSIRNQAHFDAEPEEGDQVFPFVAFREMLAEVQAKLESVP